MGIVNIVNSIVNFSHSEDYQILLKNEVLLFFCAIGFNDADP